MSGLTYVLFSQGRQKHGRGLRHRPWDLEAYQKQIKLATTQRRACIKLGTSA